MEQNSGKATADVIRKLVKECGTTVFQACKQSGVTPSTFYRWQSGSEPSLGTVRKMRAALVDISAASNKPLSDDLLIKLDRIESTLKSEDSSQKFDLTSRIERLEKAFEDHLGVPL
jgi:transcriptional regulator with XRE-family HTH domain